MTNSSRDPSEREYLEGLRYEDKHPEKPICNVRNLNNDVCERDEGHEGART